MHRRYGAALWVAVLAACGARPDDGLEQALARITPDAIRSHVRFYLDRFNHQRRDNFREEWSFESAVRMSALSVRLARRLADAEEMPQFRSSALPARARSRPLEPYFFFETEASR